MIIIIVDTNTVIIDSERKLDKYRPLVLSLSLSCEKENWLMH